jgi:hypothetical protein
MTDALQIIVKKHFTILIFTFVLIACAVFSISAQVMETKDFGKAVSGFSAKEVLL